MAVGKLEKVTEITYTAGNKPEFSRVVVLLLELDMNFRACLTDKTIKISQQPALRLIYKRVKKYEEKR